MNPFFKLPKDPVYERAIFVKFSIPAYHKNLNFINLQFFIKFNIETYLQNIAASSYRSLCIDTIKSYYPKISENVSIIDLSDESILQLTEKISEILANEFIKDKFNKSNEICVELKIDENESYSVKRKLK